MAVELKVQVHAVGETLVEVESGSYRRWMPRRLVEGILGREAVLAAAKGDVLTGKAVLLALQAAVTKSAATELSHSDEDAAALDRGDVSVLARRPAVSDGLRRAIQQEAQMQIRNQARAAQMARYLAAQDGAAGRAPMPPA